jgi:hypothetical protein
MIVFESMATDGCQQIVGCNVFGEGFERGHDGGEEIRRVLVGSDLEQLPHARFAIETALDDHAILSASPQMWDHHAIPVDARHGRHAERRFPPADRSRFLPAQASTGRRCTGDSRSGVCIVIAIPMFTHRDTEGLVRVMCDALAKLAV